MFIETLCENGSFTFENGNDNQNDNWTLTCVGDTGPRTGAAEVIDSQGAAALFDSIKPLVDADFSIVNLETALTSEPIPPNGVCSSYRHFEECHKTMPFDLYALANNHVKDAGDIFFTDMLNYFDENSINYVGGGHDIDHATKPFYTTVKNTKIGILAFAQDETQVASETQCGTAHLTEAAVLDGAIELVTNCDVSIVILHEGFEFMDCPRIELKKLCHKLVNAGVKMVFCHHSHTPQGIDYVNGSLLFYSLGNFMFDMPHYKPYKWTRYSFVPKIHLAGRELVKLELQPFKIVPKPFSFFPIEGDELKEFYQHLKTISIKAQSDIELNEYMKDFMQSILLPEFFGCIQGYGNQNDGDFSTLIADLKDREPVHKLFQSFINIYGTGKTL